MDTYDRVRNVVSSAGCDFCGVADLTGVQDFLREQGGETVCGFPRAVSIGIALPHAIVDELPRREERAVAVNYRTHAYTVINQRLELVASAVASALQRDGYRALPIPATEGISGERLCAVFSHKLAAHLAGLGWIGKSCLLVTPQAGPRVRWTSVLTDAPLAATGQPLQERCGECRQCVDICPVHAYTGRPFRDDEPRSARYDARACHEYLKNVEGDTGMRVCGMCLYVCPHGRKGRGIEDRE